MGCSTVRWLAVTTRYRGTDAITNTSSLRKTVQYKDLESNSTVDVSWYSQALPWRGADQALLPIQDLILFPGDATFSPVSPSSRVYVLRFTSSSARHFYWMQDVETTQDARRAGRVNALIEDVDAPEQQQDVASMEGVTS